MARVRDRDVHTIEMPYFGGVAMLAGVAAAILISWQLPFLGRLVTVQQDSRAVLVAATVICLVGVLDDVFELPPLTKFAGQVFAAGIAVALGVKMLWIPLPNQIVSLDSTTSVAITVFFIVLCSNAVNFVDGLDGLATGVVGIGALAFFAYSYLLTVMEDLTRATTSSLDHCHHRWGLPRFPAAQLLPSADVHGRLRRDVARSAACDIHHQPHRTDRHLAAARRSPGVWFRLSFPWCCRWQSSPCRSSISPWRSSVGPTPASGGSFLTNSTCTTGSWNAATASAVPSC